jgi:hypothetical protein
MHPDQFSNFVSKVTRKTDSKLPDLRAPFCARELRLRPVVGGPRLVVLRTIEQRVLDVEIGLARVARPGELTQRL